ncbi:hypothetical protein J437_LFUL008917 [Ladona fulva]|uniref:lysozyme n=1 Tax=Ladona fulva TaxID=123851 RepID=A0A8K0KA57_LADFU|nr:hypothetical protein J437_LFUL008917 [Ladona fulva]
MCEAATGCNLTIGCDGGYCGPFHVSRVYWVDAGSIVLPDDEQIREGAYQDCANDYHCGLRIVTGYLDCNEDDVVDCNDYALIHYNGGYRCEKSISHSRFYKRYSACIQDSCNA